MRVTSSGTTLRYEKTFLPKQREALEDPSPEILFSGAWGCGKTRLLCEKVLFLCVRYPGNRVGMFRKTAKAMRATTLRKLLEPDGDLPPVIPPALVMQHHKKEAFIRLRTDPPSEILYGGMDQRGADGDAWFNSIDFGAIAVDQAEELTEEEYSLLQGRLRHPAQPIQQAILVVNPKGKSHWLYRRFFLERVPGRSLIESCTLDNTFLPKSYLSRLSRFVGPYYQRFVLGKWIDMEGLVYDNFDPTIHILDRVKIPPGWKQFWAVDFGYARPFCAQLWIVVGEYPEDWRSSTLPLSVPEGSMILAKDIYYSHRLVASHADRMKQIAPPWEVRAVVADWDADGRATIEEAGYYVSTANKDIEDGIQGLMHRLGNYTDPTTGKYVPPTLFIFADALDEVDTRLQIDPNTGKRKHAPLCTSDEFGFYQWAIDRYGKPKKTEVPADEFNHGMDAARYAVQYIDGTAIRAWIH